MPGYVIHLALAEEIVRRLDIRDDAFVNQFFIGSIIPDVFKASEKKESHFWSDETFKLFVRKPDVRAFEEKYHGYMDNPYVLGYYAHLLLDAMFIDHYWLKYFLFYNADMRKATLYDEVAQVYLVEEGSYYPREVFFSKEMYYGDYDIMNSYMINKHHIRIPELSVIPDIIEEVNCKESEQALNDMIRLMEKTVGDTKMPQLKVFNLGEIEALIDCVAEKIVKFFYARK